MNSKALLLSVYSSEMASVFARCYFHDHVVQRRRGENVVKIVNQSILTTRGFGQGISLIGRMFAYQEAWGQSPVMTRYRYFGNGLA